MANCEMMFLIHLLRSSSRLVRQLNSFANTEPEKVQLKIRRRLNAHPSACRLLKMVFRLKNEGKEDDSLRLGSTWQTADLTWSWQIYGFRLFVWQDKIEQPLNIPIRSLPTWNLAMFSSNVKKTVLKNNNSSLCNVQKFPGYSSSLWEEKGSSTKVDEMVHFQKMTADLE